METWKAVGAGVVAFLVALGLAVATNADALLLVGFPGGFVAGYASDGYLSGVLAGVLTGLAVAGLVFGGSYYVATTQTRQAPGVGLSVAFMGVVAVGLAVESAIASAVASLANR